MKITNSIRIKKEHINKIQELQNNIFVDNFHKTLLKGIMKNNNQKNLSKADTEVLKDIFRRYQIKGLI